MPCKDGIRIQLVVIYKFLQQLDIAVYKARVLSHLKGAALQDDHIPIGEAHGLAHGDVLDGLTRDGNIRRIADVKYFIPEIKLQSVPHEVGIKNVLLIGCVIHFKEIEAEIIKKYSIDKKYKLYVKPHPCFSMAFYEELIKKYNFTIIKDRNYFPDVDCVISYDSTLAYEYQLQNIEVHIHSKL